MRAMCRFVPTAGYAPKSGRSGAGPWAPRVPRHARQALSIMRPVRRGRGARGGARPDVSIGPEWLRAMKGAGGGRRDGSTRRVTMVGVTPCPPPRQRGGTGGGDERVGEHLEDRDPRVVAVGVSRAAVAIDEWVDRYRLAWGDREVESAFEI